MATMTVTVLLFASYAEQVGSSTVEVAVPASATVGDVLRAVAALPTAGSLPPAPLVAVNQRYAALSDMVTSRDEIAIIPPVAGG